MRRSMGGMFFAIIVERIIKTLMEVNYSVSPAEIKGHALVFCRQRVLKSTLNARVIFCCWTFPIIGGKRPLHDMLGVIPTFPNLLF